MEIMSSKANQSRLRCRNGIKNFVRSALFGVIALAEPAQATNVTMPTVTPVMFDQTRSVLSFASALEQALPSVVRIVTLGPGEGDQQRVLGSGSGAIFNAAKGLVITNEHVVRQSNAIRVEFPDGRNLIAEVVGKDEATDIALLRIRPENLVAIPFADSDGVRVGDIAFAIGFPMGLEQTVTMGIISGLGRSGIGDGLQDYIQTDASINQGNSGGPLLDSQGRLVGINTAILSRSGGNIGIGFAVPTRIAQAIADQLDRFGEVRRGHIGVAVRDLTPELAAQMKIARTRGVVIDRVDADSPAQAAGLRKDDIVISAANRPIVSANAFRIQFGISEPGTTLNLVVLREGREQHIAITIGEPARLSVAVGSDGGAAAVFGARFRDVRSSDKYPAEAKGAVVDQVQDGSIAARRGLQPGDLVIQLDDRPIASAADLASAAGKQGPWRLLIARGNNLIPVIITG